MNRVRAILRISLRFPFKKAESKPQIRVNPKAVVLTSREITRYKPRKRIPYLIVTRVEQYN
nr:MAG TPA: hypothetical protein [Caudoviricetes sp.]DAQ22579.1 MAG TPA: hypothetical protein [Bacteriophage sp.]